jgi:hypothetical protein
LNKGQQYINSITAKRSMKWINPLPKIIKYGVLLY